MSTLKVQFLHHHYFREDYVKHGVLIALLERLSARKVELVSDSASAAITVITPFDVQHRFGDATKRLFAKPEKMSFEAELHRLDVSPKVLFVSFENLQHPAWLRLGDSILKSDIARLTSFPHSIDPRGERLPYWWNYLDWEDFPRPDFSPSRYGRLYSLEKLMTPLPISEGRIDKACFVGSYRGGPRELLLRQAERAFGLDRFGGSGQKFDGPKAAILEKYTYCVAAENSFGFGYDTEKLPETWDSGCVPVGTFNQPLSDFNPLAISPDNPVAAYEHPLLLEAPSADRVLDYLEDLL